MLRRMLRTTAREAGAFARQAVLLPRDTLAPVLPERVEPGDHVVVFLHGLFASAGVLRPMRARVGRHARIRTAALTYPTGPGAEAIAARLGELVDALPAHASIHLVGHSMGGVVARLFAVTRHDARVVSTIALASPFGGVKGLGLLGFGGARDLDAQSAVLRRVRLLEPKHPIPHLSIVAGSDVLSKSPASHALPDGEVVVLHGRGHNTVLFDREAIELVERRVLEVRRRVDGSRAAPSDEPEPAPR